MLDGDIYIYIAQYNTAEVEMHTTYENNYNNMNCYK